MLRKLVIIEFQNIEKEMMLKISFSMYLLYFIASDIVSDIQRRHKIIFSMGTVFQTLMKNLIISKICDIYDFGWLFSALQFRKRPKGLFLDEYMSRESFIN